MRFLGVCEFGVVVVWFFCSESLDCFIEVRRGTVG